MSQLEEVFHVRKLAFMERTERGLDFTLGSTPPSCTKTMTELTGGVSSGSLNNRKYLSRVSLSCPGSIGLAWGAEDLTPTVGVRVTTSSTTWLKKRLEGRSCNMCPPSSAKCWGRSARGLSFTLRSILPS
ncbi:hypothetical protein B296_00018596 [Ensete ventricosum]|uniref:Uncharacterized protein n=1 Tax=Ensete ventricosum TaxID=4639 RepID=A0A426Z218_ENSVE|nr:hypothetical protein B296_00018596 [Ensete ventricosum]